MLGGAVLVDQSNQFPADLLGEHLTDHRHGLLGGHPVAALEFARDAAARQLGGDLRPAAVHHHGLHPGVAQVDHVLGEGALQVGVDHGVAAELHDDDLVVEALEPRESLDEHGGLGGGLVLADHQLEYALFSCT